MDIPGAGGGRRRPRRADPMEQLACDEILGAEKAPRLSRAPLDPSADPAEPFLLAHPAESRSREGQRAGGPRGFADRRRLGGRSTPALELDEGPGLDAAPRTVPR